MKKWLKRLWIICLTFLLLVVLSGGYIYYFHGYHKSTGVHKDLDGDHIENGKDPDVDGDVKRNLEDRDADGDGIANKADIVAHAETLVGTLYDPLKGAYGNIGGKLGFIVCIDVPRIAYAESGIYFTQLLTADYKQHPGHYARAGGMNTPGTPYFFRRVRNVYDYAEGNGRLIKKARKPETGDIVFYSRYHATLVTGVYKDGTYDEVEADPSLIVVKEHHHKKWVPKDVARLLPAE